jgi:hypothetical protein
VTGHRHQQGDDGVAETHDGPADRPTMSRRTALGLGAAALAGAAIAAGPTVAGASATAAPAAAAGGADHRVLDLLRPEIAPREAWGADLPVVDPILPEEDVRFLLVHHTASTNEYGPGDVIDQIRGFHRFHTGPDKGWPDVAYNFFVDRFGSIWEGRAGSLAGPVRGDATGGSQGFALLCSLIGDHREAPVSDEARASLVALLAWLSERHGIATEPGTTVEFVSRGSNRWPAGAVVSAATISGHRDMSRTTCPGDLAYGLIATDLPRAVTDRRAAAAATAATTGRSPAPTLIAPAEPAPSSSGRVSTAPTADLAAGPGTDAADDTDGPLADPVVTAVVVGGTVAAGMGALAARRGRRPRPG